MSALTMRKKRSLASCIAGSDLAPKTRTYQFEQSAMHLPADWTVGDFAGPSMRNADSAALVDQTELIAKLQVFDSASSAEQIRGLLEANRGDFVSVMNILKENSSRRTRSNKMAKKAQLRGRLLRQKILDKLRGSQARHVGQEAETVKDHADSPDGSISPEKHVAKATGLGRSRDCSSSPPKVDSRELVERIMACESKLDVQSLVGRITRDFNRTLHKLRRSQSENYILKMGICQRREITQREIRKRLETQQQLTDTRIELERLVQSQSRLQQSLQGDWMQGGFGREGY